MKDKNSFLLPYLIWQLKTLGYWAEWFMAKVYEQKEALIC
jgi:hypothetical protein